MKSPVVTVSPGHKIKLSKIDSDNTGRCGKEEALQRFCEFREKICKLQEILYAERRRSLLLVFQAMDTGGKDGAINDLCAGLNPAGLQVRSFKAPSSEELDHDFLWRVHQATPAKGMIGLWNRSHYEDVPIVRVHKLVPKKILDGALRSNQSFRRNLIGKRHNDREVHASHFERRTEETTASAARSSRQMVEVYSQRSRGARTLGRLSKGLRRCH